MVHKTIFSVLLIAALSYAHAAQHQSQITGTNGQRTITEEPKTFRNLTRRDCCETCLCTSCLAGCSTGYCLMAAPALVPSAYAGAKMCVSFWFLYNSYIACYIYKTQKNIDKRTK